MKDDITFLVVAAIAFVLLLVMSFFTIMFLNQRKKWQLHNEMLLMRQQQQNQLIEAAVRSEEQERHRIAETLHDEVGAILSSSKLHLLAIKTDQLDDKGKKLHEKGTELLDDAIKKVRGISHNLHSSILKEFGLNEAIIHFVNNITQGTLIRATTALDDKYTTQNPENDISIYRMVQELINNIIKHAHATELVVSSQYENNKLTLTLFHNGSGLSQEQFEKFRYNKEGLGLKNIQNRVILLQGNIQFDSSAEGNNIKIQVPVKDAV